MRENKKPWLDKIGFYYFKNCFLSPEMFKIKYIIRGVNNIEKRKPPQKPNFLVLETTATIKLNTIYIPMN